MNDTPFFVDPEIVRLLVYMLGVSGVSNLFVAVAYQAMYLCKFELLFNKRVKKFDFFYRYFLVIQFYLLFTAMNYIKQVKSGNLPIISRDIYEVRDLAAIIYPLFLVTVYMYYFCIMRMTKKKKEKIINYLSEQDAMKSNQGVRVT